MLKYQVAYKGMVLVVDVVVVLSEEMVLELAAVLLKVEAMLDA